MSCINDCIPIAVANAQSDVSTITVELKQAQNLVSKVCKTISNDPLCAKFVPLLFVIMLEFIGDSSVRSAGIDALLPGLLNLFDKLTLKQRKSIFLSLGTQQKLFFSDINEKYSDTFKFSGKI
jgi:hypothetical protein